ncbi:MAG: hypothetical protein ACK5H1_08730 [Tenacibaculum sp.]
MGFVKKEMIIGFLISLFATTCGLFIYLQYVSPYDFSTSLSKVKEAGILGTVIALAAIPNLFVFFIFLKKKQDHRAAGVLIAVITTALLTFALRFF